MNKAKEQSRLNPLHFFIRTHLKTSDVILSLLVFVFISVEIFSFSISYYALNDLLGEMDFWGIRWATVLAIAFCGIGLAGFALNLPPQPAGKKSRREGYLFGVWMAGATLNTILTWWGLSIVMANQPTGNARMIEPEVLANFIPVFMAVLAGLVRILISGTLAKFLAGTNLAAGRQKRSASREQLRRLVVPLRAGSSAPFVPRPFEHSPGTEDRASHKGTQVEFCMLWPEPSSRFDAGGH